MLSKLVERVRFAMQRSASPEQLGRSIVQGLGLGTLDTRGRYSHRLANVLRIEPARLGIEIDSIATEDDAGGVLITRILNRKFFALNRPPIVSMGAHCYTSAMMMRWGLRDWAGPFDWLFSSPGMIAACLADDFASLLDRKQYLPVPLEERRAGKDINRVNHAKFMRDFGIEFVFNHHDVHLDEGYSYLKRCVARYRECIAQIPAVHLLTCWYYQGVEDDLRKLAALVQIRNTDARLIAFVVHDTRGAVSPRLETIERSPALCAYTMNPHSRWQPLSFPSLVDELAIVNTIAIDLASQ